MHRGKQITPNALSCVSISLLLLTGRVYLLSSCSDDVTALVYFIYVWFNGARRTQTVVSSGKEIGGQWVGKPVSHAVTTSFVKRLKNIMKSLRWLVFESKFESGTYWMRERSVETSLTRVCYCACSHIRCCLRVLRAVVPPLCTHVFHASFYA